MSHVFEAMETFFPHNGSYLSRHLLLAGYPDSGTSFSLLELVFWRDFSRISGSLSALRLTPHNDKIVGVDIFTFCLIY